MSFEQAIVWAKTRVGCGYVYGATGWVCTPERRAQQAVQYPEYAKTILTTAAKWDGKICYDCAQFVKAALRQADITLPSGATSQWKADKWREKHKVSEKAIPDDFCVLFRADGDIMQHVGLYVGGRKTIDARSTAVGVVERDVDGYGWTHWAVPKTEERKESMSKKIVATESGSLNLRSEPDGKVIDKIPKGTVLMEIETQGDWSRVEVSLAQGEMIGWVASRYLSDVPDNPADETVTVSKEALWAVYNALGEILGVRG